jgi:hypothetical protein
MSKESDNFKLWMCLSTALFIALLVSGYFKLFRVHPTHLATFTFYPILFLSLYANTKLAAARKKRSSVNQQQPERI